MTEQNPETAVRVARDEAMEIQVGKSGMSLKGLGEVFVASKFFKDVTQQSQAIVKMLYGQELGLAPIQSMLGIHMIEGRPELAAATMAMLVKRSGKYRYTVKVHTAESCELEFFERADAGAPWLSVGVSVFDQRDAETAGLLRGPNSNHVKYPKAMKFARAMSQGVRMFCLDAVGGIPVYAEGEITEAVDPARGEEPQGEAPNEFAPRQVEPAADPEKVRRVRNIQRKAKASENTNVSFEEPPASGEAPAEPPAHLAHVERRPPPDAEDAPEPEPDEGAGEPCPFPHCILFEGHAGNHRLEDAPEPVAENPSPEVGPKGELFPPAAADAGVSAPAPAAGKTRFSFAGADYATNGFTEAQMRESFDLVTRSDKKFGRGYSRKIMAKILHEADPLKASRNDMTEAQGTKFLDALREGLQ